MPVAAHRARAAASSRSARSRRRASVSISTDATCAMCIECSCAADQRRRVVHDAAGRHRHLRREQLVAPAEAAGAEHVRTGKLPPLRPEEHDHRATTDRRARQSRAPDRSSKLCMNELDTAGIELRSLRHTYCRVSAGRPVQQVDATVLSLTDFTASPSSCDNERCCQR